MKRVPAESVEALPYPRCETTEAEVLAEGTLRAGPRMADQDVVETYRFTREACRIVAKVQQSWSRGISEVEVVYDLDWTPLRAWKRSHTPVREGPPQLFDIRRYEMRTQAANVIIDGGREGRSQFWFRGGKPIAVVGPGRALLYAFIQRAHLSVGQKLKGPVLDFRNPVERVEPVALRRDPDRRDEVLGRTVRVYTVFGRESVFADEQDRVIGDLAGLVPAAMVSRPLPELRMPETPPDPIHTP
jgi:hypothetical protein